MKKTNHKSKRLRISLFILSLLSLNLLVSFLNINFSSNNIYSPNNNISPEIGPISSDTYQEEYLNQQWLTNNDFNGGITPWFNNTDNAQGDLDATYTANEADFELLGEERTFSVNEEYPWSGSWTDGYSDDFPTFPDSHGDDNYGLWVSHQWNEDAAQSPTVHWDQNFTMPVNMTDYIITSASIEAYVNGTVTSDPGGWGQGGIDTPGDTMDQFATYDYARYYVIVSDLDKGKEYEVASNQTVDLGKDSAPGTDTMSNILMEVVDDESLLFFLTSVLGTDGYNFTITLGIRIWCEDSFSSDSDYWDELYINSFNMTFTYEKKIDQLSSVSWNQIGSDIAADDNPIVTNASVQLKYKVNQTWVATTGSQNSEIAIKINNEVHSETIKLRDANETYQEAIFDVTSKIPIDVNINITIELFIWDDITLGEVIKISIDDVYLNISYYRTKTAAVTTLDLFLDGNNRTIEKEIEVNKGDQINISVMYKNVSGGVFIDSATVEITGDGISGTQPMQENGGLEYYNYTLDTNILEFGNNYLTVTASKFAHEPQTISNFKVKVLDIQSNISKILIDGVDYTANKTMDVAAGKLINITVKYTNLTSGHISGGLVKATTSSFERELNESIPFEQYNITLNTTSDLGVGVSFVTISGEKDNHTSVSEKLTIIVWDAASSSDLFLNGVNKTDHKYIQLNVNVTLNITVSFKDDLDVHIPGATVNLTGAGIAEQLAEIGTNYTYLLNTTDLNQGINFLTVYATKDGYQPQALLITVDIVQEQTDLTLKLNGTDKTLDKTYEVEIGEKINVTITYKLNDTGLHIGGSTVQITGGYYDGVNLTEQAVQYSLVINSTDLNWGVNYITVYAHKSNYEAQSITFKLTINDKTTSASLFLEAENKTTERYVKLDWNEELNVTIIYVDNDSAPISSANVSLTGTGISKDLTYTSGQFELYLNTTELTIGINFVVIVASASNYESQSFSVQIEVNARVANITKIFLNQSETNTYEIAWNELLNITIYCVDNITQNFIDGVTVELVYEASVIATLLKPLSYDQYNYTLNTSALSVGLVYLTITVELENYTSLSEVITINVLNRATDLEIYLNQTQTTTIDIDWNETLDIAVEYNDTSLGSLIEGATVELRIGETVIGNFTRHPTLDQYNLSIKTATFNVGALYLTIAAIKTNFTSISTFILIKITERDTYLEIFMNGQNVTESKYIELPLGADLNVTIQYYDLKTDTLLSGATIELSRKGASIGFFIQTGLNYSILNNTYDFATGIELALLAVEASLTNYTTQTPTLSININPIRSRVYPKDGKSLINALPGDSVTITIELQNLDFPEDGNIEGATIIFTTNIPDENLANGTFTETTPGVYQYTFNNLPEGEFIITITVVPGGIYANYEFQTEPINLNVRRPSEDVFLFQMLMMIAIGAALGLGGYAIYYQKVGKYPKPVRKVRNTNKMFKKGKFKDLNVLKRDAAFKALYLETAGGSTKYFKGKSKGVGGQDKFKKKMSFSQNLPQKPDANGIPPGAPTLGDSLPKKPEDNK